jgi:hypothetical protein
MLGVISSVYIIIGGDGKEYGPVSADQVRAWIAAGRANLGTQAKEPGSDDWKSLGDFPEFQEKTVETHSPPPLDRDPADLDRIAETLIARAGKLDVLGCYERSWSLLKANFWPLLGVSLMIGLISTAGGVIPILGYGVRFILTGVFSAGLQYYYLRKIRGQRTEVGDAFAGFSLAFIPLVIGGVLCLLFSTLGLLLLIVPGVYLAVAYQFTYLLILDRKLGFWEAMEVSRRVISAQWWRMFGLLLLAIPLALAGIVCLIVGIFVAMVLIQGAVVYAYEDLCNPKSSDA